ncbi:tripartite tricarboxylate transporter substrate binding protein [Pigmentiphaga sp. CHJ604]|uniref:Bug family tripartite tricarboxylate transporter substrate binding protein n=1 Tax=Pigmentiphaga sp. CHJ604 TaxID=3081984 RepID=UPI0030CEB5C8
MRSRIKLREYLAILCAALAAGAPAAVRAQDYPSRPVMVVNTWAPGGPSDAIIRPLLEKFSQKFGQPFVLENRSGANGSIGTSYVARSRNDGYTLLFANVGPIAISPWLPDKPSYDSIKDFQPIGQIQSAFVSLGGALELIRAGKLKAIAVSTQSRSSVLPDVPAVSETVPGFDFNVWYGLMAPAGTPRDVVQALADALKEAMAMPDIRNRLLASGLDPHPTGPAEFARKIEQDLAAWKQAVANANLTP